MTGTERQSSLLLQLSRNKKKYSKTLGTINVEHSKTLKYIRNTRYKEVLQQRCY